ncbi:hypothetical protein scyTo_0016070 [Scyliorhinus torazame]|uniref:exodeoxyribonuclease III n=1 Tax=Scyliorhinus torazame TaxID=75743 RepID=A0A401Q3N1_SCYTO|nr:hypothetical protein [Scyliorhinus torazame]
MPKRAQKEEAVETGQQQVEPVRKKTKHGGGVTADEAVKDGEAPPAAAAFEDTPDNVLTGDGKWSDLTITSWNVDGLRAWVKKNSLEWVTAETPDILCLQETKCAEKQLPAEVKDMAEYPHQYWSSSRDKEGYSGVGMLCKIKPLDVTFGIGVEEHDNEGRESDKLSLPISTSISWSLYTCRILAGACSSGDRPGFTAEERQGFGNVLAEGFIGSYRHLYPDTCHAYTFWTYLGNSRAKNMGWRLDYFVLSKALLPHLCDSKIRCKALRSDHCPITLLMAM